MTGLKAAGAKSRAPPVVSLWFSSLTIWLQKP